MEKLFQIKKDIIKKIEGSKDVDFLEDLKHFLELREQGIYELSPEQQNVIDESWEQISKGDYIDNDILFKEIEEWLQNK